MICVFLFYISVISFKTWAEYIITNLKVFLWEKHWPFSLISGLKIHVSCLSLSFLFFLTNQLTFFVFILFCFFFLVCAQTFLIFLLKVSPCLVLPFQTHPLSPLPVTLTRSAHINEHLRKNKKSGWRRRVRWRNDEQESKSWNER